MALSFVTYCMKCSHNRSAESWINSAWYTALIAVCLWVWIYYAGTVVWCLYSGFTFHCSCEQPAKDKHALTRQPATIAVSSATVLHCAVTCRVLTEFLFSYTISLFSHATRNKTILKCLNPFYVFHEKSKIFLIFIYCPIIHFYFPLK
jgi:hypothetical protein